MRKNSGSLLLSASVCVAMAVSVGIAQSATVPLTVTEVLGQPRKEMVTSGIPLPRGALQEPAQARLTDADGRGLPMYSSVLSRWQDGSVKWLLIQCPAEVPANGTLQWSLVLGEAPEPAKQQVQVADSAEGVLVTTGPLRFAIGKAGFRFIEPMWLDANPNGEFELPAPRAVEGGKTIIVLGKNQKLAIPVGKTVRRLHFFGHVCCKMTAAKEAKSFKFPVTVEPGTPLEAVFAPVSAATEWGINALVLRPVE